MQNILSSSFRAVLGGVVASVLVTTVVHAKQSLPACDASSVTTMNNGSSYLDCIGSFSGNINGSVEEFARIESEFGFAVVQGFNSDDFAKAGNPFAQNVGSVDSGKILFDAPVVGNFVLGLKQGNAYSLYAFDGGATGLSVINYDNRGVFGNDSANPLDLSHAMLYTASAVPEPESLAMLLAGLGVLGVVARRRSARS